MTAGARIRYEPGAASDYPAVLALNDSAVPAVNRIDAATLLRLHAESVALIVARDESGGGVAGFMLAMNERSRYESVNFQYFLSHYDAFVYIDRIVVSTAYRRMGIGEGLYIALEQRCSGPARLTCEVNVRPPNPGSLAFHQGLGFEVVAHQDVGAKRVALMVKARGAP